MKIPGFVDLQVNGFMGVDYSAPDLPEEAFINSCRSLLKQGTAAFLPTVITSALPVYQRNLPLIARAMAQPEFHNRLLGIHLEGPFISAAPGAVGAHNPAHVRPPDLDLLRQLLDWGGGAVRMLTLAAEQPGADDLARFAVAQGIAVSVGHSIFDGKDLERMVKAGATALTHLGNGLPNLMPRHPNPIWAGLAEDQLTAMVIADGHHLPAQTLKVFLRAKGVDRTVVVSDAAPVAGLPPGRYRFLDNDAILEESGRFYNPVKQCLVGSSATMLQCMNYLASLDIATEGELVRIGYENPLRLIGADPRIIPPGGNLMYDREKHIFAILPV